MYISPPKFPFLQLALLWPSTSQRSRAITSTGRSDDPLKIGVCFSWGLKKKKRCGQTVETKGQQMDNWLMNSADDLLGFTDASNGIDGIGGGLQNVERLPDNHEMVTCKRPANQPLNTSTRQ